MIEGSCDEMSPSYVTSLTSLLAIDIVVVYIFSICHMQNDTT